MPPRWQTAEDIFGVIHAWKLGAGATICLTAPKLRTDHPFGRVGGPRALTCLLCIDLVPML